MLTRFIISLLVLSTTAHAFVKVTPVKSYETKKAICEAVADIKSAGMLDLELCVTGSFFKVKGTHLSPIAFSIRAPSRGFNWVGLAMTEGSEVRLSHVADGHFPHLPCSEKLIAQTLPQLLLNVDSDSQNLNDFAFKSISLEYNLDSHGVFNFVTVWELAGRQFTFADNVLSPAKCQ